jgi:hypothetical protein
MEQQNDPDAAMKRSGSVVGGTILIAVGTIFLLDKFLVAEIWQYWPLILIAIGVANLFDGEKRGWGFTLIAVGTWLLIATLRLFGLNYGNSWPILLILIGTAIILDGAFGGSGGSRLEKNG